MRFTMKRTLALVLALMLAMPTFVLADGEAMAQDANGQITANELVLNDSPALDDGLLPDDDLLLDGDLVLDGLSPELTQPEDPSGDLELGSQDPAEGGAGEQPDASEAGAPGEPPLELGDDAQVIGEELPDPQPLMPPDDVLEATMEVENVTDPAMAANDGEKTPWQQLAEDFQSKSAITLTADCIASESDARLISATSGSFALNLDNNTINRNLNASKEEGNVIKTQVDMTVNGPGKITGGKTKGNNGGIYGGGGIAVDGASTLSLAGGAEITGNLADSAGSHGCGGGVYLREPDSATGKNRLIMNNSAILSNTAAGFGGGVYLEDYAELEMNNGAIISDNNAQEGGGVVVDEYASFNMKGGSITGNHANGTDYGYGGGISLRPDSTFTMENGQITGNHADFKGGGVYISDKSTFTMTGGTIEDNFADSADCNGGGVYVGGTFSIGGGSKISITGNTKNGNANNVYLPANKTITVNGTLSDDSIIGVTTANVPSSSNGYIPITNRFSKAYLSKNSVFISDNANYEVGVINNTDTDKQLGLGLKIVHKAESVSVDYDGNDHSPKVNVTVPEGSDQTVVTYKGELPEKVGKYTVEYEVSNSATVTSKYCFPAKGKGTVTIRPVVRIEGWTYGEQPKTPTVESASLPQGATLAYEYFTDADCTKKTTSADGASSEGGAPRNAGTYYVRATATVNSNEIKSLAKSFTIKSASMKGSAKGYKGEYDGRAHGITVSVTTPSTGYTVKYGTTKGTYDKSSLTYTEAGNYTVYYQVTAKNYVTVTGSETVEITAKASDNLSITLSQAEYTYDGAAKKPTVTVKDKKTGQVVPEKEYKVTYANNVNAGTATVTLTDVAGGNYIVNGSKTFTIKSASMTVSAKSYKGEYDGKAHGITVSVTKPSTGYTVMFGSKAGTYDKSSLTYTNEGTYTVYYQVTAPNYVTVTGSATVEITAKGKATMTVSVSSYKRKYDGKAHGITVNVTNPKTGYTVNYGTKKGTYDKSSLTYTDVGLYTVYYQVIAENYKTVTGSATVEIIAKALDNDDLVIALSQAEYTYDGAAKKPTVTVKDKKTGQVVPEKEYKVTYANNVNAGTATVTLTDVAGGNYVVNGDKTFTINKAAMVVEAEGYKGEYDGKAHGITVNVTEPKTGYTVKYGAKEGTYDKKSLTYTDAGVYTVYYQVTAENYETVTGSAAVEITAKASDNLNITLSQTEYTYDGTAKKPTVTVTDKDTKQIVPASEYSVTYSDNVNAGTAKVTLTDAEGGNYAVKGIKTFTIKGAAMTIEAKGYNGEYDGKAHGITVNVTDPQKGRTVKYGEKEGTYNRDSLTYTDAGVYTVYYQITAKNYETVTGSAKVEITAKELDNDRDGDGIEDADSNAIITLEPAEYTYDGKAKKPLVTVTDKDTGLEVPLWEFRLYFSNNVNIGTAKVTISDAEGGNYTVKGVKTFAIKGKPMTVAVNGYEGKYDGEAHGITVNVIEPSTGYTVKYGEKEGTYDKDSLTYTDVGVYTVYYQVTAEHYETVTGSATVEITANEKASMTVVAEDYKGEYDREAHGIKVTVTEPKTGYTVKYSAVDGTYDKESLTYTDTGVYTVYYQVTAENYETVTGSAKVEITARVPTDLTIDLSAKTYYYYAKARKPTVTVKDGDTVVPESEYRVTYKNNIHAGTATVKITSLTKGNYRFAEERNFTIKPRNVHLKYTKLTFTYDGKYHLPLAKAIGVYPADENKYNVIMTGSGRNVGRYIARTTGIDNPDYHMLDVGEETRVIFYINPRGGRGSGSSGTGNARFVAEKKIGTEGIGTVTYDGKAQEPKFVVKCVFNDSNGVASNTVLTVPASEYKVTYSNNVDVGKATVKVTDVPGGNFIVDFSTEFTIAPRKATVTAKDQHVKTVDGVKTGVMAVRAKGLAKGHVLKSVKLDVSIKEGAKKGRIVPGKVKIVDAEGKDVTRNYKLDYVAGSLAVTAPKPDFTLLARMTVSGNSKKALKVAWTDVADACAYDVYFAKCGSEFRLKKTVKASKPRVVRFKGLDKRVSYKAYVKAWKMVNNQKVYIGNASPQVHAITGGYTSQECNTQSVKLNRTRLTLKAGGSASLKAKLKCVKSGKKLLDHADKVRWYSTDANVATVDANGKVNAVGKGSCTIYAIANNGVRSSAKVKVK